MITKKSFSIGSDGVTGYKLLVISLFLLPILNAAPGNFSINNNVFVSIIFVSSLAALLVTRGFHGK